MTAVGCELNGWEYPQGYNKMRACVNYKCEVWEPQPCDYCREIELQEQREEEQRWDEQLEEEREYWERMRMTGEEYGDALEHQPEEEEEEEFFEVEEPEVLEKKLKED